MKILVDSGASSTLVRKDLVKKLRIKQDQTKRWVTVAGEFNTAEICKIQFKLTDFSSSEVHQHKVHICPKLGAYDMILG